VTKFFIWLIIKLPEFLELYKKYEERQKLLELEKVDAEDEKQIREAWEKQDAESLRSIFSNKPRRLPAQPPKGE